jgi:hypothetical protein
MKHFQSFEIRGASLQQYLFKKNLEDGMFLLSNRNIKGEEGALIHLMKFYNRLSWEYSFDINIQYPNFRFR